jgi:hypothetical protein
MNTTHSPPGYFGARRSQNPPNALLRNPSRRCFFHSGVMTTGMRQELFFHDVFGSTQKIRRKLK